MTTDNASNPDPVPSPAPALTDEVEPQEVDLLADIQPGGLLDKILDRSNKGRLEGEASYRIHGELRESVEAMRRAAQNPKLYLELGKSNCQSADISKRLIWLTNSYYKADPVLRYCLKCHWSIDKIGEGTYAAAWEAYVSHPGEYDEILEDFIPTWFHNAVWNHVFAKRYDSGINPTAADDWAAYQTRLQRRRTSPLLGLSTGLPQLDRALRGLHGLTFLGGGPGAGKTSLALFIAANALRNHPKLGVLFYGLDMSKTVLFDRLLCQEAGMDYADLLQDIGEDDLRQRQEQAETSLSEILPRLRVVERLDVAKNQLVKDAILKDVIELEKAASLDGVFVIVDYFQLLPLSTKVSNPLDADFDRVKSLQSVQQWSRTYLNPEGFPVLVISEVRKGETGRSEISIGDLMGSARLGYSADAVMLLDTPGPNTFGPTTPVRLQIAKSRDGTARGNIDLVFEHTKARFREAPRQTSGKRKRKPGEPKTVPSRDQDTVDPLAGLEDS